MNAIAMLLLWTMAPVTQEIPGWLDPNLVPYELITHTMLLGDSITVTIDDELGRPMGYTLTSAPEGDRYETVIDGKYVITYKPTTAGIKLYQLTHQILLPVENRRRHLTLAVRVIEPEFAVIRFRVETIPDPNYTGQ